MVLIDLSSQPNCIEEGWGNGWVQNQIFWKSTLPLQLISMREWRKKQIYNLYNLYPPTIWPHLTITQGILSFEQRPR